MLLEDKRFPVEISCETIFVDVILVNSVSVAMIEALDTLLELIVETVMSPVYKEDIVASVDTKLLVVISVLKIDDVARLVIFAFVPAISVNLIFCIDALLDWMLVKNIFPKVLLPAVSNVT